MNISYVAGFIEGEGSFCAVRNGTYPRLQVGQNNRVPLDEIAKFLQELGIKATVYSSRNNGWNTDLFFTLVISGKKHCRALYTLLLPEMHHPGKIAQMKERWTCTQRPDYSRSVQYWIRTG
jgi:hypothetical protein